MLEDLYVIELSYIAIFDNDPRSVSLHCERMRR